MNKKMFTYIIMGLWFAMAIFCFIVGYRFMQKLGTIKYYTIVCWGLSAVSILMALMRFVQQRNESKRRKNRYFDSNSKIIEEIKETTEETTPTEKAIATTEEE